MVSMDQDQTTDQVATASGVKANDGEEVAPLRTYGHDVAERLRREDTSVVSIAIQEQARKAREVVTTEKEVYTSKFLAVGIVVFVLVGISLLTFVIFFYQASPAQTPSELLLTSPLIQADSRALFDIEDKKPAALYHDISLRISEAGLKPNALQELVPIKSLTASSSASLSIQEFFVATGIKITDRLVRFLEKGFMLGIYSFRNTNGFIVVRPISHGPVFAEMLAWEKSMPKALYPLLSGKQLSTENEMELKNTDWRDEVLRSIDARVLRTASNQLLLMYAFLPTKNLLVITTSVDTFNELVLRAQTAHPVAQ